MKKLVVNAIVQAFKKIDFYGSISREQAYQFVNNRVDEDGYEWWTSATAEQITMRVADMCGWND